MLHEVHPDDVPAFGGRECDPHTALCRSEEAGFALRKTDPAIVEAVAKKLGHPVTADGVALAFRRHQDGRTLDELREDLDDDSLGLTSAAWNELAIMVAVLEAEQAPGR